MFAGTQNGDKTTTFFHVKYVEVYESNLGTRHCVLCLHERVTWVQRLFCL